ncbi:MAG: DUF488 domain-containing protein [Deltaproteobacteria bacterium]|nr:DUF488 domain-containing protein [Deltaproteobacteria bacterium]
MLFFTIGYGGRQPQQFLHLLRSHGVKTVVDVRLRPDRASMGVYSQAKSPEKGIQGLLRQGEIDYLSLIELGNLFRDNERWRERYRLLLERVGDLLTERLISVAPPFCLLCAEQQVSDCHRLMIAEYLVQHGWEGEHIE